jgi:hypothetical protein
VLNNTEHLQETKLTFFVVNKDNKLNVFEDQAPSQLEDVVIAVAAGNGFHLTGPRGLIVYAPGTVRRVGVVEAKQKKEKTDG